MRVHDCLLGAEKAQHVVRATSLDGNEVWSLTTDGAAELELSKSWRADMWTRVCDQVRAAATDAFGSDPASGQIQLWARLIDHAIRAGVRADGGVYVGAVDSIGTDVLVPRGYDVEAVRSSLATTGTPDEVRDFLFGCVVAALDTTDVFCSELVSTIIVSFVLHAAVARRDQARAQELLGTLAGQRAVLDTPVLIKLLGPSSTAISTERVLRCAVAAGVEVIVADHTLDELAASLAHAREHSLPKDRAELNAEEIAAFGRLVDNDIVALAAEAVAEGRYSSWEDFENAAVGIRTLLGDMGVSCRPHGNNDGGTVRACRAALVEQLATRPKPRPAVNLDRDADTMAMVWRTRRRHQRDSYWPGGWVITTDQSLTPAMRRIEKGTPWQFALTVPQLAAILTRCADVPSVGELTQATATLVRQDAVDALASRYPVLVASELAKTLAPDGGGSVTDIRVARAGLHGVLSASDIEDPTVVTAKVLRSRQRRMNLALEEHSSQLKAQTIAARDQVSARDAEIRAERAKAERAEASLAEERARGDLIRAKLDEQQRDATRRAAVWRRQRVADGVLVAHLFAIVLVCFWWHPGWALLPGVSALLLWPRLRSWARDGQIGVAQAVVAGVPDVVTVGVWVWSLVRR